MERQQTSPDGASFDGEHSGHYQIRRRLGEGGFGQVFEAWDPKLCRSIALKRLKAAASPAQSDRLVEEGRLAASLQHTAFVKIFSIEGDGDSQSIIMELVQGDTLRQFAQDKALPETLALGIVCQVVEAIEEAHAIHLVHGDIKPSNLMVEPSGKVRILDFGLARQIDPLATQSNVSEEAPGTIAYMSSERLLGDAPSARGDVYSLGVVLYELVAGQRPFPHLGGLALAAAHIQSSSDMWHFPPALDPAVVALVRAMTARDPAQRLASMQAVRAGIRAITHACPDAASAAAVAPPSRLLPRLLHWMRARRAMLGWGGGMAALLLVLSAWLAFGPLTHISTQPYSEAAALRAGLESLRAFEREGSLDSAVRSFSSILEHNPRHAAAAAGLSLAYAQYYVGDGRDEVWLQRAAASAQQAIKEDDQLALAYAAQAWVRDLEGKHEEALRLAEQALALDPRDRFALQGKIEMMLSLGRLEEAERCIGTAMAAYPLERLFVDLLGTLRYQQGNYPAAEKEFRRSIQLDPDSPVSYANLNAALLRQNRNDDALQVLQQGLQIHPHSRLYDNLGTALFARGDYVGAARAFEHSVSSGKGSPNDYFKWANLADALRWIPGRGEASRHAYQQAADLLKPTLARSPKDSTAQSRMGLYLAKLGDKQAAAHWTALALAGAPANADVHFRAAVAYEVSGLRDEALAQLLHAKALGYPPSMIDTEPDFLALRRDTRYHNPTKEAAK